MRLLLTGCLFILFVSTSWGQLNRDSLRRVIRTTENDTVRLMSMSVLAVDLARFSPDSLEAALAISKAGLELAHATGILEEEMFAHYDRAYIYYMQGNLEASVEDYQAAIGLAADMQSWRYYHNFRVRLSTLLFEMGRQDEGLAYTLEALDFFETERDSFEILGTLGTLIHGYTLKKEYDKAKRALFRQLNLKLESPLLIETHGNLGLVYARLGMLDSAVYYMEKAAEMGIAYPRFLFNNQVELAKVKHEQGKTGEAVSGLESLMADYPGEGKYVPRAHLLLSKYYLELGRIDAAANSFATVEDNERLQDLQSQEELNELGYRIALAQEDYPRALTFLEQFNTVRDSLTQIRRDSAYQVIQSKYDVAQKDRVISQQKLQTRNLQLGVIGLGGLLVLIVVIFFLRNKNQQIRAALLQEQARRQESEIEFLRQENQLVSMQAILEGQEEERKRIAQDLHDNIGSMMAAIKMKVMTIQENIEALEQMKIHQQLDSMVSQVTDEVRRISHNMTPVAFELAGLKEAVQDLCYLLEQEGIVVQKELEPLDTLQDKQKSIILYRLLQEMVQNILKHAQASEVRLVFRLEDQTLSVQLTDNGVGLDPAIWESSQNLGIRSIQSRVAYLGGTIEMVRMDGTQFSLEIPIF
jgi:signal transduction histidine kinase